VSFEKLREKKEKIESRKASVRKNTPFSVLRPQNALKNPSPKAFEVLRIAVSVCVYVSVYECVRESEWVRI